MTHDWDGVADLNFEYQVTYTCADPAHKIFYGTSELEFFTIACLWSGDWSTDVSQMQNNTSTVCVRGCHQSWKNWASVFYGYCIRSTSNFYFPYVVTKKRPRMLQSLEEN